MLGVVFRVVVLAAPLEVLHFAHLTLLVPPLNAYPSRWIRVRVRVAELYFSIRGYHNRCKNIRQKKGKNDSPFLTTFSDPPRKKKDLKNRYALDGLFFHLHINLPRIPRQ